MGKRTIDEDIKKTDRQTEHLWIKYPREPIQDVTLRAGIGCCSMNHAFIGKSYRAHEGRPYTELHTHPDLTDSNLYLKAIHGGGEVTATALPNSRELSSFASDLQIKTMVIAQRDLETGEMLGKTIIRKPKGYKFKKYNRADLEKSEEEAQNTGVVSNWRNEFEKAAEGYGLHYRFVPNNGYEVKEGAVAFTKKGKSLETKVVASLIGGLFISALFFFNQMTGFVISDAYSYKAVALIPIALIIILIIYSISKIKGKTK